MSSRYIFESERLGFRNWQEDDLKSFAAINADEHVMEHLPKLLSTDETLEFIHRLQNHYDTRGFCYYATEVLETGELIGFIGLTYQDYKTEFTPAVDIGWRLGKNSWGKGYATEGAKRCLQYGFEVLKLDKIIAYCTLDNTKSESVMQKIGMNKKGDFKHPKVENLTGKNNCLCYEASKTEWLKVAFK